MESRRERENEPVAILVGRWVENDVALHGTLPPFISEEKFWKEMKVNVSLPMVHGPVGRSLENRHHGAGVSERGRQHTLKSPGNRVLLVFAGALFLLSP